MRWRPVSLRVRVMASAAVGLVLTLGTAGYLAFHAVRTAPVHPDAAVEWLITHMGLLTAVAVVVAALYTAWDVRVLEGALNEARSRQRESDALYRTSREILAAADPEQGLQAIVEQARAALNCEAVALCLVTGGGGVQVRAVAFSPGAEGSGVLPVAAGQEPPPGAPCQNCSSLHTLPETWLHASLSRGERELGMLCAVPAPGQRLSADDASLLRGLASLGGLAAERARMHGQLQALATMAERERLARELHDSVAQTLSYLYTRLRVVQDWVGRRPPETVGAELGSMAQVASAAFDEVRDSIFSLRAPAPQAHQVPTALAGAARDFTARTGIPVDVALDGLSGNELAPEVEVQLLRIVQEALANVARHARANRVWIRTERNGQMLETVVSDDGTGFVPGEVRDRRRHFGLDTMRERAEAVGGELTVESAPGKGTRVRVRVPITG